jgi:surface polysaccharide O-acyltransferase-like enzyme
MIASAVTVMIIAFQDFQALSGLATQGLETGIYVDIALPAVLALIWIRSIPVPGLIARGLALIASSTLYIYLTHFQFQSVARHLYDQPALAVVIAIAGGIAVGYAWNKGVRILVLLWNKGAKKTRPDTIERVA